MEDSRRILLALRIIHKIEDDKTVYYRFNKKNPLAWLLLVIMAVITFVLVGLWEGLKGAYTFVKDTLET